MTLGTPDEIYFFQNPEDLLSYWTLHKKTIDHSMLFALSDDSPRSMIDLLNEKLEQSVSFKQVNICINKDKEKQIPIKSVRPFLGGNWQDEVKLEKERMKEIIHFREVPAVAQQMQQQLTVSMKR